MMSRVLARNYLVSVCASMCMIQYGYDADLFSAIQVFASWTDYMGNPNNNLVGAVTTAYNVAAVVVGVFLSPRISEKYGRRWPMISGSVLVIIGAFVMTFGPNIGAFIAGRVLVGAGQGLNLPAGPVYIDELVYPRIRGRLMTFWQTFYSVGNDLAVYIALGCSFSTTLGAWQWRLVVIFQILSPIILIVCLLFSPETPRWLMAQRREEDARKVLLKVREPDEVEAEIEEIRAAIAFESEKESFTYVQLFRVKSYRRRLILAILLNFGVPFTGIGALGNYSGIIYKKFFPLTTTILIVKAVQAAIGTLTPLIAYLVVDRWGRKPLLFWGAIAQGIILIVIAVIYAVGPKNANGTPSLGVGIGFVVLIIAWHSFYGPSWGAVVPLFSSEIFALAVRADGVAISAQSQQLATIIWGQVTPDFLATAQINMFYFFVGCNFILAAYVYWLIPETKLIGLEHMDVLFGGVDHVLQGEKNALDVQEGKNKAAVISTEKGQRVE